jgi:dihydroorotate dehydrogenase electron transfer subunit
MPDRSRGLYLTTVVSNRAVCREHFALMLRCPAFPPTRAGQFVQIASSPDAEDEGIEHVWEEGRPLRLGQGESLERSAFLRRPFSLAGRRDVDGGVELSIIGREVGVGTAWLGRLRAGDSVSLIGPLGNAFTLPPAGGLALMVGGGVGIPPMIYLASAIAAANAAEPQAMPRRAGAFCGALTRDLLALTVTGDAPTPGPLATDPLYNVEEFAQSGVPAVISTDDGSYGYRGLVTHTLEHYLDRYLTDNADRARTILYTCGPEGMMKAVAAIAARRKIVCQVCVERAMACGMGTCQSCVIRVKKGDPALPPLAGSDWCYRLACTDGPIFTADRLLW